MAGVRRAGGDVPGDAGGGAATVCAARALVPQSGPRARAHPGAGQFRAQARCVVSSIPAPAAEGDLLLPPHSRLCAGVRGLAAQRSDGLVAYAHPRHHGRGEGAIEISGTTVSWTATTRRAAAGTSLLWARSAIATSMWARARN